MAKLTQAQIRLIQAEANRRGLSSKAESRPYRFSPFDYHPKQRQLRDDVIGGRFSQHLFGGAAGPGKSTGALILISELVETMPIQVAVIRKHFEDMTKPGALKDKADQWWKGTGAHEDKKAKQWRFPSGAVVQFGGFHNQADFDKWQGGEYHLILADEGTQLPIAWLDMLATRLRRLVGFALRPQLVILSNPGGRSHNEIRDRFVMGKAGKDGAPWKREADRNYIPATHEDNPSLDVEDYRRTLDEIKDPVLRKQMRDGDWSAVASGIYASRDMFQFCRLDQVPVMRHAARGWDIGLTAGGDATASAKVTKANGNYYVLHANAKSTDTPEVRRFVLDTAARDEPGTVQVFENQTVSIPVIQELKLNDRVKFLAWQDEAAWARLQVYGAASMARGWDADRPVHLSAVPCKADKLERASLFFEALHERRVFLVEGDWNEEFIDQFVMFTNKDGDKDDLVDAAGNATHALIRLPEQVRTVETGLRIRPTTPVVVTDEARERVAFLLGGD